MQFTLSITGASAADLQTLLGQLGGAAVISGEAFPLDLTLPAGDGTAEDFPGVPDATGKGRKAATKKANPAVTKKPTFVDPGDAVPAATNPLFVNPGDLEGAVVTEAADPFAGPATESAAVVELDDFGDPVIPAAPATAKPVTTVPAGVKITIDLLRTLMQTKSTSSPENKVKCKAIIDSYNVTTLSMIPDEKFAELYVKINAV